MFGISMWEIVLILLVALIVLGPKQLTEVAKTLGKLYGDLQRMSSDVRHAIDLDSPLPPPSGPPEPAPGEAHRPAAANDDFLPGPGEKPGPDFYADLLESSKEEETKKEKTHSEDSQDAEHGPLADKKKDGSENPPVQ